MGYYGHCTNAIIILDDSSVQCIQRHSKSLKVSCVLCPNAFVVYLRFFVCYSVQLAPTIQKCSYYTQI